MLFQLSVNTTLGCMLLLMLVKFGNFQKKDSFPKLFDTFYDSINTGFDDWERSTTTYLYELPTRTTITTGPDEWERLTTTTTTTVRETFSADMSFPNVDIFYPFGPEFGDNLVPKVDDSFVGPIDIATTFPFFDRSFTSLFVNTNGLVSFDTGVTTYVPIAFPLPNIISVAPFWSDVDIRNGGDILYREITDYSALNLLSYDIQKSFPDFTNFRVTWAFVTTWYKVAAFGSYDSTIDNTFQLIIATNGRYSFTIFNYGNLEWSFGTASGGKHAQAGFNAGDGKYLVLPGSFSSDVLNLNRISNVNVPGKYSIYIHYKYFLYLFFQEDGFFELIRKK